MAKNNFRCFITCNKENLGVKYNMNISLNSYQPSFKAIRLNRDEREQVRGTLNKLQKEDLPEFQRNILKSDVMDVFIPHIKQEVAESDDPKAKSVDLNMKLFDALNSFTGKKDPVGWFLSVLNGTKYEDPKPTIFDMSEEETAEILAQIEASKQKQQNPRPVFNFIHENEYRPSKTSNSYFDFEIEKLSTYSPHEIHNRAVELRKYFGQQYKLKDMLNIVETNQCLVSYDNKYFDKYVTDFAETMGVDKNIIKNSIATHPVIVRREIEDIRDRAKTIAQLTGCREEICKYALLKRPKLIDVNPHKIKDRADALSFYKAVRNKREMTNPKDIFSAPSENVSYSKTLTFLVACKDQKGLRINSPTNEELVEYLNSQGEDKTYKFILPEHPATEKFINYATDFEEEYLDRDMFDFEVINAKEYARIEQPKSFIHFDK